jgi:hypothetical protein
LAGTDGVGRGIPGGYLNSLEQRLDETENALYNALAELKALKMGNYSENLPSINCISGRRANATKSTRMAEWKTFPLKSSQDIQRWWEGVDNSNGEADCTFANRGIL